MTWAEELIVYSRLVGTAGHAYAIEANPEVFVILERGIQQNKLVNVTAFNLAIGEETGFTQLNTAKGSYPTGSLEDKAAVRSYEVEITTLESLFSSRQIPGINLLKANIEGSERYLGKSLFNEVKRVRNFSISFHDLRYRNSEGEFFKTKDQIIQFLTNAGMNVSTNETGVDYVDDWVYATCPDPHNSSK